MEGDKDLGEKTEAPTARKRQEAREQGNLVSSREVNSVCVLLIALITFSYLGPSMFDELSLFMRNTFENLGKFTVTVATLPAYGWIFLMTFLKIVMPFMLIIMVAGLLAGFLQHGFYFSLKPLMPNFSKINIFNFKGIKSIFSKDSLVQLLFSIIKLVIIVRIVYLSLNEAFSQIVMLPDMALMQIFSTGCEVILRMCFKICLVLVVIAIADFSYQKWQYEKNLRMTKEEIRDEAKKFEGNPQIKSKIRSIQMQLSRKRMMASVPEADVIITNPTHYAIAVKYDAAQMRAPKVLAKGARLLAQKIREIAIENDVPIVENKPLARALYKTVEVGQEVPEKLYQAVAEILAYVYQLNKGKLKDVMRRLSNVQTA